MNEKREISKLRGELNLVSAEKSNNSLRIVCILALVCMTIITVVHYVVLSNQNEELSNRVVYIDPNGLAGTGTVKSMEDKDIMYVQIKANIKYSVPFLYSFNSANYDSQIERGLKLFGNSGKEINTTYINDNVREKVYSSNLEVSCVIDDKDIKISEDKSGLHANITLSQTFVNGGSESKRLLNVSCDILRTKVSETNPFGFLIENWVILS